MFKNLLKTVAIFATCFTLNANAQSDTSYYDLGRIRIKKDFAQGVTVNAKDLEKYPTTSLSDAINAWLSGRFTRVNGVVYVIDGDLINNVNAYSIFDIESITYIENATTAINGVNAQQSLVLIKTRINRANASGINVAGQTNLIANRNTMNLSGDKTFYHQYYISAYKNTDNSHFGLSADYQHDAQNVNSITGTGAANAQNFLNRVKLFGYFENKIGNSSVLNIGVNYVAGKQSYTSATTNISSGGFSYQSQNQSQQPALLNFKAALTSAITPQLNNKLSFNYSNLDNPANIDIALQQAPAAFYQHVVQTAAQNNFLLRDNLQYNLIVSGWDIEPALNFTFRYAKQNTSTMQTLSAGPTVMYDQAASPSDYKVYLLTPSVNISYKSIFNIQGGVAGYLNASEDKGQKLSPFVTASVDILRLTKAPESYSWKVFASYANYSNFYDNNTYLPDFASTQTAPVSYITTVPVTSGPVVVSTANNLKTFNNFQTGSNLSFFNNRLSFAYSFEKRQYSILAYYYYYIGAGLYTIADYNLVNSQQHRVSVTGNILNSDKVKWFSTLNAYNLTVKYSGPTYTYASGPINIYGKEWTGGWVNQVEFKKLSLGADMVYAINETTISGTVANSFVLQNAYIAYAFKTKAFKNFTLYANSRNLAQNTASDITDNRKFYGLGFKAGF